MSMIVLEKGVQLAVTPAPGARPRGRLRALLLVFVTLVMTSVMGLSVAPPARAALPVLVPLAAAAMRAAPSALKAFIRTPAGKSMVPAKWSTRAGLGVSLVGGVAGLFWDRSPEMGVGASEDMQGEAVVTGGMADEVLPGRPGMYSTWTITGVEWGITEVSGLATYQTFRVMGTCVGTSACPSTPTGPETISDFQFLIKCHTPGVGYWDMTRGFAINRTPITQIHTGLCNHPDSAQAGQVASFTVAATPGAPAKPIKGLASMGVFYNPNFNPEDAVAGPADSVTVTRECVDAAGAVLVVSNTLDGAGAVPEVACPAGTTQKSVEWTANKGTGTESLGGFDYDFSQYPECAGGQCHLQVSVDGQACRVGVDLCYNWQAIQPQSRVSCVYGPYVVGVAECSDMAYAYRTEQGVTWSDPANDPSRTTGWVPANPDGSPNTNLQQDWLQPDPNPKPGYDTGPKWEDRNNPQPGTEPSTGTWTPPRSGPNPNPNVGGAPLTNPETGGNCMSSMWSWNPVDWVLVPIKCGLSWAFVPKTAAAETLSTNATRIVNDVGLGPWLSVPATLRESIPVGEGCEGPRLALPQSMGGGVFYPLNACQHPLNMAAEMTRAMSSLVLVVAGVYSIINSLTLALTGYRMVESTTKDVDK